jgi:hypothetical protein
MSFFLPFYRGKGDNKGPASPAGRAFLLNSPPERTQGVFAWFLISVWR